MSLLTLTEHAVFNIIIERGTQREAVGLEQDLVFKFLQTTVTLPSNLGPVK